MLLCDRLARVAALRGKPGKLGLPDDKRIRSAAFHMGEAAATLVADLTKCSVRFVLDDDVIAAATNVVASRPASIRDCVGALRVPWPMFWVEWREPARIAARSAMGIGFDNGMQVPDRFGFLVRASEDGRRGDVRFCWWHEGDEWENAYPSLTPFALSFDFDVAAAGSGPVPSEDVKRASDLYQKWAKSPDDVAAIDAINGALTLSEAPEGTSLLMSLAARSAGAGDRATAAIGEAMRQLKADVASEAAPFVAVLMMLAARNAVVTVPEDRSRLNKARAKRGEHPLFDHVTTRMRLGREQTRSAGGGTGVGEDSHAVRRAHAVRGHFVNRSGTIYWRRAHTRGLGSGVPAAKTRTVHVTL